MDNYFLDITYLFINYLYRECKHLFLGYKTMTKSLTYSCDWSSYICCQSKFASSNISSLCWIREFEDSIQDPNQAHKILCLNWRITHLIILEHGRLSHYSEAHVCPCQTKEGVWALQLVNGHMKDYWHITTF